MSMREGIEANKKRVAFPGGSQLFFYLNVYINIQYSNFNKVAPPSAPSAPKGLYCSFFYFLDFAINFKLRLRSDLLALALLNLFFFKVFVQIIFICSKCIH